MTTTTLRARTLACGLSLTFAMQGCGGSPESAAASPRAPVSVRVSDAWSGGAERVFAARIEAARQADVATRASGVIRSMPVDVGDRVGAGQVVAVLDGDDVSARIRAAEAQRALAEQTHGRMSRLAAEGAASRQELDQATAALAAARAAVAEATAQASYIEVKAPFAGVVVARAADPGDLAVPGRAVLRIQGGGAPLVVADLPSDMQPWVSEGRRVRVSTAATSVVATLTRVVPSLDPATRRFRVEGRLDEEGAWSPGTVVRLAVSGTGRGSRWIPDDAVVRRGQLTGVFTVEADTLRLRWIRLGRRIGDAVEVLAGPAASMTVVRRPTAELADGQPVSGVTREEVR